MIAPPRRMIAAAAPPSGRRLPAKAMSTGTERVAMPVRVKPSIVEPRLGAREAAVRGLGEIEAAGRPPAERRGRARRR